MKNKILVPALFSVLLACSCGGPAPGSGTTASARPTPTAVPATPAPSASIPKDGDYDAKGVVTKVNTEMNSVELDHEDIPGLMPPMKMEFYVTDKKMLDGLRPGDRVEFVVRYKHPGETIVKIVKAK